MSESQPFDAWGMLELFGHQKLAGRLTEQSIGGCHFIRIDVPEVESLPEYTRLFTQGAIYGVTITTEGVARKLAANLRAAPIKAYDIAAPAPAISYSGKPPSFEEEMGEDEYPL